MEKKRQKTKEEEEEQQQQTSWTSNLFDLLSEELVFAILDFLDQNPRDRKSFSLVSKTFHSIESKHRKVLKPLRAKHICEALARYPNLERVDLTLCPRVSDSCLARIASSPCAAAGALRGVDLSRSRFFTAVGVRSLAERCLSLTEIDLSNAAAEVGDEAMAAVAAARNLERLRVSRCRKVSDLGIGCVAVGCEKLKLVCLKWCLGVGDFGVSLLATKCKHLRTLDLSHLPITHECLPSILKLQHLEDLALEGCFGIDDESLEGLKIGSKSLKKLNMSNCQNISHVGLSSLATDTGQHLQELALSYVSHVTLDFADSLGKLRTLQSVKLDGCPVTCGGLKAIGNWCASLRELSLRKCPGVTDDGLSSLVSKHGDLRKLDITCCHRITCVSIAMIASSCAALTSLKMESCPLVRREAFVLIGRRCRSLEELDLTDNEIDDEGLKFISKCSKLASLKLGICLNITDKGIAQVGFGCSKLNELDLYRCTNITDYGISAIASGCPDLETINLAYCKDITDASLISLSTCMRLNTLESRGCPLITSLGLVAIAVRCQRLAKLDVKKCSKIDDAGMIPLAYFSQNLRQINLSYSSVTDAGLLTLSSISCLQSLTILHVKGLTPGGLAAALLTCDGLTKVKLHESFKSSLPQHILQHLEARGCVFHWRDKVLEAELDPHCWKLRFEDMM